MMIHTGEKPFKCLDCGKVNLSHKIRSSIFLNWFLYFYSSAFVWSFVLISIDVPILAKNLINAEFVTRYKCNISCITHYWIFLKSPFMTHYCIQSFRSLSNKCKHEKTHTGGGEKKYKCKVCSMVSILYKIFK